MKMDTTHQADKMSTIREMCDEFCVTARTLRFYEQKGLITPLRQGQKRLYARSDRGRLKLILRGKRFGFALEEIRQLLDLYDRSDNLTQVEKTFELGLRHLEEMEKQHAALNEAIADLHTELDWTRAHMTRLRSQDIND